MKKGNRYQNNRILNKAEVTAQKAKRDKFSYLSTRRTRVMPFAK